MDTTLVPLGVKGTALADCMGRADDFRTGELLAAPGVKTGESPVSPFFEDESFEAIAPVQQVAWLCGWCMMSSDIEIMYV